jgi:hypothetical protein
MKQVVFFRHFNAPKVSGETDMSRGIELKEEDLSKYKEMMLKHKFAYMSTVGMEILPFLLDSGMNRSKESLLTPIEIIYEGLGNPHKYAKKMSSDKIAVYATNTIDQKIDGIDKGFAQEGDIISHIAKQIYTGEKSFFDKNNLPLNLTNETLNATLGYFSLLVNDLHKEPYFLSATHGPTNDLHQLIALQIALQQSPKEAKKMLEYIAENGATKTGNEVCSYNQNDSGLYLFNPNGDHVKINEQNFEKLAKQYNHKAHQQHKASSEIPYK